MKITKYNVITDKIDKDLVVACVSDIHGRKAQKAIEAVRKISPDVVLLAGDILEISVDYMNERNETAIDFLKQMVDIAPSYYCFGNHEIFFSHAQAERSQVSDPDIEKRNIERVLDLGVHIVNNKSEKLGSLIIGGLVCGYDMIPAWQGQAFDLDFLNRFDSYDGFKILLCHYPHLYDELLKNTSFDLILSGHAHGGQWRFLGRGVYAPHQGLFPKYTSGIYDGRFIISRGASNNVAPIPRFFNPCEVLQINLKKKT
ncbi:MAG: hypothetical protein E7649_06490 [Ruminococcaceae bacterium]|nr:hypothetical protein [Oscillospiraceae bacterium]